LDENRPQAVERRRTASAIHGIEQRTARANVEDLCDDGSWIEYGALVIAGQRRRRGLQDLRENTPADGMLCGLGTVNAETFGPEAARCMILAYDYTVLAGADNASFEPFQDRLGTNIGNVEERDAFSAGTQGGFNHKKKDRMFEIAERLKIPSIFFAEGGGGRPGDTDVPAPVNISVKTAETSATRVS